MGNLALINYEDNFIEVAHVQRRCWHYWGTGTPLHWKRYLAYFFTGDISFEVNDAQSVCDECSYSVSSMPPLSVSVSCSPSKRSDGSGTKSHLILWSYILSFKAVCTVWESE